MKMMLRRLAIVVCVALALLSAAYAFAVLRTHSGTGFWKVWLVLAVVFALLAIGIACHWWAALPGSSGAPSSLWWPSALSRFAQ